MKKTFLLLFAAAALMLSGANASAQVSFGAGPTTRLYFEKGKQVNYTYGVQVNFEDSKRLTDVFGYSAGIDFGTYGKKDYYPEGAGLNEMYVDLPVRAKFYVPISGNTELFFFGGVVPSMCVSSVKKPGSDRIDRFYKYTNEEGYFRYDVLAGGGIGIELNESYRFTLGYDQGLLDRFRTESVLHVAAVKFTFSFLFY